MIRVLLVDDHPLFREGLRFTLEQADGIEVVAEASDGHEALSIAEEHRPDVVVMDLAMPRLDGLAAKADTQVFGADGVMRDAKQTVQQLNAVLGDARASLKKVDAVLDEAKAVGANARVATADLGTLRAEVEASLRKMGKIK